MLIRIVLALFILCRFALSPAYAINWKGHDDWLEESPHALELERNLEGRAAPLPRVGSDPKCQKREEIGKVPANPYEPVPMLCDEVPSPSD